MRNKLFQVWYQLLTFQTNGTHCLWQHKQNVHISQLVQLLSLKANIFYIIN